MSRESFILQFIGATGMTKKNTLSIERCVSLSISTFPIVTSNCWELLKILWKITSKSDEVPIETFVQTMQHLDNLYFKTGELNGQVIFTAAFYTLDSSYSYYLDSKETAEFFKRIGDKNKAKKASQYIKDNDENGDGVLQLNEFLGAFDSTYQINKIPINDFLRLINYVDHAEKFNSLPKRKGKVYQEDVVTDILKNVQLNERRGIETQLNVLARLSSKDKEFMRKEEYVKMRRNIDYVVDKIGRLTTEVLMTCIFRVLDQSYSASLDNNDLSKMLKASGMESRKKVVLKYIEELDENGDGVLQLDEMLNILKIFVNKQTFDIGKYLKNIDAHTSSEIIDCLKVEKSSLYTSQQSFIRSSLMNKPTISSETINYQLYSNTLNTKYNCNVESIKKLTNFLFLIANNDENGTITKVQFNLIVKYLEETIGKTQDDEKLCRTCFQLNFGSKGINIDELKFICSKMGKPFQTDEDVKNALIIYNDKKNGLLNEDEFVLLMMEDDDIKMDDTKEERERKNIRFATKVFRLNDRDGDGHLNEKEILVLLTSFWGNVSRNNEVAIHMSFLKNQKNDLVDENGFVIMCRELEDSMDNEDSGEISMDKLLSNIFYQYVTNGSNAMDRQTMEKVLLQFKCPATLFQAEMDKNYFSTAIPHDSFVEYLKRIVVY